MQKAHILLMLAGVVLIISVSCERNDYNLLDPDDAGVWTLFDKGDGLPGNTVSDIKLDKRGNLWMTFPGEGTAKYRDGVFTNYLTTNSLLLNNAVNCLDETAEGDIVFGTSAGVSILSTSDTWDSYRDPVNLMIVTTIKVASDKSIWVGTYDQGFYVNRGSGFVRFLIEPYRRINVIEEDVSGNIWLGTGNGIIRWNGSSYKYFSVKDGLPENRVTTLRQDKKNRLWIGTHGGKNVAWFDGNSFHDLSLLTGKDSCTVNDIYEDRRGYIWFATKDDGLICYNGILPRSIRMNNGLPGNTIKCIGEDKNGNLWFSIENKGVVRYTLPLE